MSDIQPPSSPAPLSIEAAYFANRPKPSLKALSLLLNKKRRARVAAQAATIRGAATSYIDQDDSGTYDPKLSRKTPPPIKTHWAKKLKDNDDGAEKESKWRKPKGYGFIITFKFTSKPALDYLQSIPAGPESSLRYLSQVENDESSSDSDESESHRSKKRRTRTRTRTRKTKQPLRYTENTREDGLTLTNLALDNPLSKGCKSCFLSGDDCSLIPLPLAYPCESCRDAGAECEFIIPPLLKKACEPCKRKKVYCSYRYDGGLNQTTCENCEEDDHPCVACPLNPVSSYAKRFLPSSDVGKGKKKAVEVIEIVDDGESEELQDTTVGERVYKKCNQCRWNGTNCSLKSKTDQGPCTCCAKINDVCAFVVPHTKNSQAQELPVVDLPRTHTHDILNKVTTKVLKKRATKIPKRMSRGHELITISTSFGNPILFNYIPEPGEEESKPCHFCQDPFFGCTGNEDDGGPRQIEGYWLPHGQGFHEVHFDEDGNEIPTNEGWQGYEDDEQTRMCCDCTTARLKIWACSSHHLTPVKSSQIPNAEEFNHAAAELEAGDVSADNMILRAKLCSVCPEFARQVCGTGCGLHLCSNCAEHVNKVQNGGDWKGRDTVDSLVRSMKSSGWKFQAGMRADAKLLTTEGELVVRMNQGMFSKVSDEEQEVRREKLTEERQGWKMLNDAMRRLHDEETQNTWAETRQEVELPVFMSTASRSEEVEKEIDSDDEEELMMPMLAAPRTQETRRGGLSEVEQAELQLLLQRSKQPPPPRNSAASSNQSHQPPKNKDPDPETETDFLFTQHKDQTPTKKRKRNPLHGRRRDPKNYVPEMQYTREDFLNRRFDAPLPNLPNPQTNPDYNISSNKTPTLSSTPGASMRASFSIAGNRNASNSSLNYNSETIPRPLTNAFTGYNLPHFSANTARSGLHPRELPRTEALQASASATSQRTQTQLPIPTPFSRAFGSLYGNYDRQTQAQIYNPAHNPRSIIPSSAHTHQYQQQQQPLHFPMPNQLRPGARPFMHGEVVDLTGDEDGDAED